MPVKTTGLKDNPAIGLSVKTVRVDCVVCGRGTFLRRYRRPLCPWCWNPKELNIVAREPTDKGKGD